MSAENSGNESLNDESIFCKKCFTDDSSTAVGDSLNKKHLDTFTRNHKMNPRIMKTDYSENKTDLNCDQFEYTNTHLIYMKFMKLHYKTIITYIFLILLIIMTYCSDSSNFKIPLALPQKDWLNIFETKYDIQRPEGNFIQAHSAHIYEEMLKNLHYMQQAASYLQLKQQIMERKANALQRQIKYMTNQQMSSNLNQKQAKEMIENALLVYDADKLGLRDYALDGSIISTPETKPLLIQSYSLFQVVEYRIHSDPKLLIQTDIHPGNCFAFEGTRGRIRIKLSNIIYITAVTLENTPTSLLLDEEIKTAPKEFEILGFKNEKVDGISLGTFKFLIKGSTRQTFFTPVENQIIPFQNIELFIHNNYGNRKYTCVYRLRVHGKPVVP